MVGTKEMYDLMEQFERDCKGSCIQYLPAAAQRVERHEIGRHHQFYVNGVVNDAFRSYMAGYAYHKSISRQDAA